MIDERRGCSFIMITFLNGKIDEKHPTRVVLDVGGVGYEVLIPLSSYDRLPGAGESCRILTYDHVREDAHQLFGFMSEEERGLFVMLMGISGIGPKLALSALSGLSVTELTEAIASGDVKRLTMISGVGRKVAERIVVELKDKIGAGQELGALFGLVDSGPENRAARDAVMALIALGYQQSAARKMVQSVLQEDVCVVTVEDIVKKALGG